MEYRDIEWFALEMNRDHSVVFEIASKYCVLDSFVDHDDHDEEVRSAHYTVGELTNVGCKCRLIPRNVP